WEPHRATWLSWPHNRQTWPDCLEEVEDAFCEIVRALLPDEAVEIHVSDRRMEEHVRHRLAGAGVGSPERIRFHAVPTDDAWIRDHGGVFVVGPPDAATPLQLVDFEFDAWGGKYPPWDRDAAVPAAMAARRGVPRFEAGFVLEGGSIEGDGEGTILTTESCLLNPNRNRPGRDRSRESLEHGLSEILGARKILWLAEGIEGDDTDGHIDDITRFVGPGRVLTLVEPDEKDPNRRALMENRRRLEAMTDARGRRLEVIDLPTPGSIEGPDGRLPASYANFYIANRGVLLPVFGVDADREAIRILEHCLPDRPVLPIPSRALVRGLGAVHCLTQQEPALPVGPLDETPPA
ncbi:MAG: agmatine deiminase family protein, partial [bacterium]